MILAEHLETRAPGIDVYILDFEFARVRKGPRARSPVRFAVSGSDESPKWTASASQEIDLHVNDIATVCSNGDSVRQILFTNYHHLGVAPIHGF